MKYRRLGRTGMKVSVVGLGTWQFGGEWGKTFEQSEVDAMFRKAEELGINLADTAECYGDGTSERFIGAALKGRRDRWVLATKFGHKFNGNFERSSRWSAKEAIEQLEASLKNLQTDRIDLTQFHSGDDGVFDNDELWTALGKTVRDGKVRFLGTSIGSNDNLHQTRASLARGVSTIQVVYNRLDRKPEERVLPSCIEQELGVLARVPLASGFLSGKFKPGDETTFSKDEVRGHWWTPRDIAKTIAEVERIKHEEVPKGAEMAGWALAWVLKHPAVSCVIPGVKSVAQVESNARAAEFDFVAADHPHAVG